MYRIITFCTIIFLFAACDTTKKMTSNNSSKDGIPKMVFKKKHIELGKVAKGDKRTFSYPFTNKGNADLVIEIASSCHCTTLDYPTKPIPPGGKGTIEAIFDSTEKEKSETVMIDIILKGEDPKTGYPIVEQVTYSFEF